MCLFLQGSNIEISLMKKTFADTLEIQYLHSQKSDDARPEDRLAELLAIIFSTDVKMVLSYFDEEYCADFQHKIDSANESSINVNIPIQLARLPKNVSCHLLTRFKGEVSLTGPKVRISKNVWTEWCKQSVQQGLKALKDVYQNTETVVKHILLFGELSHNAYALNAMKLEFDSIIVPDDEQYAKIRGACIFGHHPDVLQSRIVKSSANVFLKEVLNYCFKLKVIT